MRSTIFLAVNDKRSRKNRDKWYLLSTSVKNHRDQSLSFLYAIGRIVNIKIRSHTGKTFRLPEQPRLHFSDGFIGVDPVKFDFK